MLLWHHHEHSSSWKKAFTNTSVLFIFGVGWHTKTSHGASDADLPCSLPSLRPRSASACGSCEHVRTSSGLQCVSGSTSHLHPTSSLSLLQLVSERGISATVHPNSLFIHRATASSEERQRHSAGNEKEQQGNIFSVNLVEKLRSLGLYKVVARGFVDSKRKTSNLWITKSRSPLKVPFCASLSSWHAAKLFPFLMGHSESHIKFAFL